MLGPTIGFGMFYVFQTSNQIEVKDSLAISSRRDVKVF